MAPLRHANRGAQRRAPHNATAPVRGKKWEAKMANLNTKNGAACPATIAAVAAANAMHKCPHRHYARQALRVAAYAKLCPLTAGANAAYASGFYSAGNVYCSALPTLARGPFWAMGYAAGLNANLAYQNGPPSAFLAACIAAGYVAGRVGLGVAAMPFAKRSMGRPTWGAGYRLAAKKRVAYVAGYSAGVAAFEQGTGPQMPPAHMRANARFYAKGFVAGQRLKGAEAVYFAAPKTQCAKAHAKRCATALRAAGYVAAKAGLPGNANPYTAPQWGHTPWQNGHAAYCGYRAQKRAA